VLARASHEWMSQQVEEPCILPNPKVPGRLIMSYSAVSSSNRVVAAIGKAWADTHSPFGLHQDEANPIFRPAGRGWDSTTIRLDTVLYIPEEYAYYIYYSGSAGTVQDRVGLAICQAGADGCSGVNASAIARYGPVPVLAPEPATPFHEAMASQAAVMREWNSTAQRWDWYTYYSYRGKDGTLPGIRLATSHDGKTWTRRFNADDPRGMGQIFRSTPAAYYALQKYLLTGDEAAHEMVKDLSPSASGYANNYNSAPESFAGNGWLASYFYSYILAKDRPTDPAVVDRFKAAIKAAADKEIGYLAGNAYPGRTPANLRWWGSNTAQGQYAYPCLLQWSFTKEQEYIDAASQLMDYVQGLNPVGKCYITGIGFNRVHNPHDRESAYTKRQGWGPRPGILVFGPGGTGKGVSVPAVIGLARERKYIDNLGSIQWSEFTIYQSLRFPSAVYPVLAQGGTYDERIDPFSPQQK